MASAAAVLPLSIDHSVLNIDDSLRRPSSGLLSSLPPADLSAVALAEAECRLPTSSSPPCLTSTFDIRCSVFDIPVSVFPCRLFFVYVPQNCRPPSAITAGYAAFQRSAPYILWSCASQKAFTKRLTDTTESAISAVDFPSPFESHWSRSDRALHRNDL